MVAHGVGGAGDGGIRHQRGGWAKALALLVAAMALALLEPASLRSEPLSNRRWTYYLPKLGDPAAETERYAAGARPSHQPTAAPPTPTKAATQTPVPPTIPKVSEKKAAAATPTARKDCPGLVTRAGDQLMLNGKPFTFVGVNVSYLLEDYFPEAEVAKIMAFLAKAGVTGVRIWLFPQHSLERAERLLDLGRKYDIRFVVTLENYYFDKGAWWFDDGPRQEAYLAHVRRVVSRFKGRPEIMMWELMNEPNCSGDSSGACPDHMWRWAKVTSEAIRALDPCRPISLGTIRADPTEEHFRRLHALETVDVVSIHKYANAWWEKEIAIARELQKPVLIGEVFAEAYDESCRHAFDRAPEKRAAVVAADMARAWAEGVDGYLLWQYAHGGVRIGEQIQYFCGKYDYFQDDPAWALLKAAPVPRVPIP